MINQNFARCLRSCSNRSQQFEQLMQNEEVVAEICVAVEEYHRQQINKSCFLLRGKLNVHSDDLYGAIRDAVQHHVDDDAASSIYDVVRWTTELVLVKCDSTRQRQRITSRRTAFSRVDLTAHSSAAVRQVLRTKLYVDDNCTKSQLRIRDSQRKLFHELKCKGQHPYFVGELLYSRPAGTKRATLHTNQSSSPNQPAIPHESLHAAHAAVQGAQQQQQQPVAEQAATHVAVEQVVEQPVLHPVEVVAEPPTQQPPTTASPPPAVTAGPAACPKDREGPAAPPAPPAEAPPAASASAVIAVIAPASKEARKQQQQPGPNTSKSTHSAVKPATQYTTRPPLRSIGNTAPKAPRSGPTGNTRSSKPVWGTHNVPSSKPAWGTHSGPDLPVWAAQSSARYARKAHMLPNGHMQFS